MPPAKPIVQQALNPEQKPVVKTGVVSATTVGGMDKTEKYYIDFSINNDQYLPTFLLMIAATIQNKFPKASVFMII